MNEESFNSTLGLCRGRGPVALAEAERRIAQLEAELERARSGLREVEAKLGNLKLPELIENLREATRKLNEAADGNGQPSDDTIQAELAAHGLYGYVDADYPERVVLIATHAGARPWEIFAVLYECEAAEGAQTFFLLCLAHSHPGYELDAEALGA